jgi:hypothetical protein
VGALEFIQKVFKNFEIILKINFFRGELDKGVIFHSIVEIRFNHIVHDVNSNEVKSRVLVVKDEHFFLVIGEEEVEAVDVIMV